MLRKKILLVEDEPSIADNIVYALETEGYLPIWVTTGEEAEVKLNNDSPHLVILDIGLPDVNGFEFARELRKISEIPIIFLTARSDEVDRIVGLELGADDYMVKPFSPRELTARVSAVLRRSTRENSSQESKTLIKSQTKSYGDFIIDQDRLCITYKNTLIELSKYEFKILSVLINRPGKVYSRSELMNRVWEEPDMSLERTVDSHIKSIRQKIRNIASEDEVIITHRGLGYSLKENS